MSLAFLSKKSWHTANLSNQEKVWMAEQQKEAEETKLKEISKQIQVEREREELERISGRISSKIDRGIDWMYEGGLKEEEEKNREAEEFLLGKAFEGAPEGSAKDVGGVETVVSAVVVADEEPEYTTEPQERDWNEEFRLRHEDPMFLVSQSQEHKASHMQAKALLEQDRIVPRKSSLKHEKHERRERKDRKERKERKHSKSHRSSRRRSRSPRSRDNRKRSRSSPSPQPLPKYGLQSSDKTSSRPVDLGPDPHLVRQHKNSQPPASYQHRQSSRRNLSSEEKARAIQEMQSHAARRNVSLHKSVTADATSLSPSSPSPTNLPSSSFINDLKCSVNGVNSSNNISMADRVQRKRHTNQRNLADGFL